VDDYVRFGPSDKLARRAPPGALETDRHHIESLGEAVGRGGRHRGRRRPTRLRAAWLVLAIIVGAGGAASGAQYSSSDERPTERAAAVTPPAADGWRWEFYRDIRVQVPSSWRHDREPRAHVCTGADARVPTRAYVSLGVGAPTVATSGCDPRPRDDALTRRPATADWVAHLTVDERAASDRAGTVHRGAWWVVRRLVGHVLVKAVSRDRTIADRIVWSAETVDDAARR
jgi:hypothetical protein